MPAMRPLFGGCCLAAAFALCSPLHAAESETYDFASAAQEITQLFWLAETAGVCGWASENDTSRFKGFSLRFLAAHLTNQHGQALHSLVNASGYADGVRRAAQDGATENCDQQRWQQGWLTYKAAADEHENEY